MELKEIFKHDGNHLYQEVGHLHSRYARLRDRFGQFVRHFPPKKGVFPEGVEFRADTDTPLLVVRFCGKYFRFCFDMAESQGWVRCLVWSSNETEDESMELGRFTFNGEGITNIIPPGSYDADALMIHEERSAHGIVASFLAAAF